MVSVLFQYQVRVRELCFISPDIGKHPAQRAGLWYAFQSVRFAIEFAATESPYGRSIIKAEDALHMLDWVIEVTLQSVRLEEIDPATWRQMQTPTWDHPDHIKKMFEVSNLE